MSWRIVNCLVAAAWLMASTVPQTASAKGSYSSSSGRSYSSHSSSSGGTRSYSSSGSSRSSSSSSGSSKSFSSGNRSYSSGSSSSGGSGSSSQRGYSSGKSYGAGSSTVFSPKPPSRESSKSSSSSSSKSSRPDSGLSFDTAAARAQKEQASKSDYTKFKDSQKPPVIPSDTRTTASRPPPSSSAGGSSGGGWRDYPRRTYVYVPDVTVIHTRPTRIYTVFGGYSYRPWVTYNDPFSSLFWWWLLDRSIDDQAWWAYHHRYDMDPARYQTLMASNQQLQARVAQLEAQQQTVPRDQAYTPTGLDRDLMYSDQYVAQAYSNRPTRSGSVGFWVLGVPLAAGFCAVFIWLIWFKRWQTAT